MVAYLSDEWIERADQALRTSDGLGSDSSDEPLVIQYLVTGTPGGKVSYTVRLDSSGAAVTAGTDPDADASFELDYPTAVSIAKGDLSVQAAFMLGKLKLGGDVTVLIRRHAALDSVSDSLAELRAETEY